MSFDPNQLDRDYSTPSGVMTEAQYTSRTFLWMMLGLMITFGVGILGWFTNATLYVLSAFPATPLVILVATLILSVTLVARIEKMSVVSAQVIFVVFSALIGFTMSTWLYLYDLTSVIFVFLATAVYFGALATYGHFTNRSLASFGPILRTGLIFLVVFEILAMLIPGLSGLESLYCLAGIAVFLGYTAYNTQRIRSFYYYYSGYPDMMEKASIFSALQLYLDFINLFLYLLRFLGNRRN